MQKIIMRLSLISLISWVTAVSTLSVAIFAFLTSYSSLNQLAIDNKFPIPALLPLTLEFGMIVFSFNALYRSLNQEGSRWQWFLVIFSTMTALGLNVVHSKPTLVDKDFITAIMFGLPSLYLLLTFENFMSQVKGSVKKGLTLSSIKFYNEQLLILKEEVKAFEDIKKQHELQVKVLQQDFAKAKTQHAEQVKTLQQEFENIKLKYSGDLKTGRGETILKLIKSGSNLSQIADEVGITYPTLNQDLKKLEAQGLVKKEGRSWSVNGKNGSN